jgi:hypothetical protein
MCLASCTATSASSLTSSPERSARPPVSAVAGSRCIASQLQISVAKSPAGRLLWASATLSQTIALEVMNIGKTTCVIDGYMIPQWTNATSGTVEPFKSQSEMAANASLRGNLGSSGLQPTAVTLAPAGSAGFIVSAGALPGHFVSPGGTRSISTPDSYPVASPRNLAETPVVPIANLQGDYCMVLNGASSCVQP